MGMKTKLLATLPALLLIACQNAPGDGATALPARLMLANGNPISSAADDDYSPIIVQHTNGFLTLVFASNRACPNACFTHNVFYATSVTAYNNDQNLPAFNTPVLIATNGSAANFTGPLRVTARASGNNLLIYMDDATIQISTTGAITPIQAAYMDVGLGVPTITASACQSNTLLGLDSTGFMLAANAAGTQIFRFDPESAAATCTAGNIANTNLAAAVSIAAMRPGDTGISDGFLAVDSAGSLTAQTTGLKSSRIISFVNFTDALTKAGLFLTSASVLQANTSAGDLLVFSASAGKGKPSDLYLLSGKTPTELWKNYIGYGAQPTY